VPRPGFLARIEFPIENRRGVMAVPTAAVGVSNGATFVYVIDADTLVVRPVETGMTAAGWVEVTSGLAGGDLVVSSGHANLRPGAAVRISEGRL
jgi:multidrug efflux pump subunit AcrA (membrane-fusion protein)